MSETVKKVRDGFLWRVSPDQSGHHHQVHRDTVAAALALADEAEALARRVTELEAEIRYYLEHSPCAVRVMEGGGPEDVAKSLAVTAALERMKLARAETKCTNCAGPLDAKGDCPECVAQDTQLHARVAELEADLSSVRAKWALTFELVTSRTSENESLRAERDRLAAVVDRLPKTADGVPIVPGMTVWVEAVPVASGTVQHVTVTGCEVVRSNSIVWYEGAGSQSGVYPRSVYSTADAARSAATRDAGKDGAK